MEFFNEMESIKEIIVVLRQDYLETVNDYVNLSKFSKIKNVVAGGDSRQLSAYNGLLSVSTEYVIIHDAARPNIQKILLDNILEGLAHYSAVVPCIPSSNSVYKIDKKGIVTKVLDRESLALVQTPQAFKTQLIHKAHFNAKEEGKIDFTDDASIISYYNLAEVKTVDGDIKNIKVTYRSDLD
jgi:2-C-methyl-D-erythritol 4-phosphate cytidylyltransferase